VVGKPSQAKNKVLKSRVFLEIKNARLTQTTPQIHTQKGVKSP